MTLGSTPKQGPASQPWEWKFAWELKILQGPTMLKALTRLSASRSKSVSSDWEMLSQLLPECLPTSIPAQSLRVALVL